MSKEKMQTVVITLSDGTKAVFTGPAVYFPGDTRSVVDILFYQPRDLPEGMAWDRLTEGAKA